MGRQKRAPTLGEGAVTPARGAVRERLRDAGSKELAKLAKKVGNSQVGSMVGAAREKRDALLAFIRQRLATVQSAQQAEQREMADRREWWLRVARQKPGFELPDPTRWRNVALAYKRAALAACAGDIGRGAQLLEQAVRAERAAFQSVPVQVELPSTVHAAEESAEEAHFIEEGETAPPTEAPDILRAADRIARVTETSEAVGVLPNNPTHAWWGAVEEEEPADTKGGKGAAPGPRAEQQEARDLREEATKRDMERQRRDEAREQVAERAPLVASRPDGVGSDAAVVRPDEAGPEAARAASAVVAPSPDEVVAPPPALRRARKKKGDEG
jgi:hypothetical protein